MHTHTHTPIYIFTIYKCIYTHRYVYNIRIQMLYAVFIILCMIIYIYTQIHINKQNICTECTHMALYLDKAMVCTPFILLPRSWAFGQPRGPAIACAASSCIVRRWWWSGRKLLYWCPEGKVIWCFLVGGFKSFYQQNMGIQPIIGIEHRCTWLVDHFFLG